ncbi:MAG: acyltransferase family protein [Paludibacteraceae bacterium]|nr:acyltransferase family protein [Paludibacteraceae bacterium]
MEKQRVLWIDYAKGVAIFCVVLLHLGINDPYKAVIRVFLLPLFFFLSGIFSDPHRYSNFVDFLKQKALKIIIPYFVFNAFTFVFWLLIGRHYGIDNTISPDPVIPLKGILLGMYKYMHHYIPLWFLACLLTVEILHFVFFRHLKSAKNQLIVAFIFSIAGFLNYKFNPHSLIWGLDIAMVVMLFYVAGNTMKSLLLKSQENNFSLVFFSVISFILVYFMYTLNDEVKVFSNSYGNYLLFYIGAFSGILFSVTLFKLIENNLKPIRFLIFTGKNTLIILSLHLISISVLKGFMVFILRTDYTQYMNSNSFILLFAILSILTLVPVILIINNYLPCILGKNVTKQSNPRK